MDHTNPKGKKLISLALIFALLISIFSALPLSASAADTKAIYVVGSHTLFEDADVASVEFLYAEDFMSMTSGKAVPYDVKFLYVDNSGKDVYKVEIPADLTGLFIFDLLDSKSEIILEKTCDSSEFSENNALSIFFIDNSPLSKHQLAVNYYDVDENNPNGEPTTTEPTEAPATTKPETTQPATEATQPTTTKPSDEPGKSTKTIYIYGPQIQFQSNNIVNFKVINTSTKANNIVEEDIIATYDAPLLYVNKNNQDVFSFEIPLDSTGYLWFEGLDSDSNVVFKYFHDDFLNWIKTDACNALYFSQISSNNVGSEGTYYDAEANLPDTTEAPTTAASATTVAAEPTEATTAAPETTAPGGTTVEVLLGDADGSGKVDVKDVTHIQKHIASYFTLEGTPALAANVDGNGTIDVNDVTLVQKYLAAYNVDYKIGEVVQLGSDTPAPTADNPQPTEEQPTTAAVQPTDSPETTTATTPEETVPDETVPTAPEGKIVFYVTNNVSWLDRDGCKLWLYNDDTDEFIVSEGYNKNEDGIAGYFYFYMPEDWVNLSIYRTPFHTTKDTFNKDSKWDDATQSGIVTNEWVKIGNRGDNNAFKVTADKEGSYITFDPSAPKPSEDERTIYFDNSQLQWTAVYIYGWSFGLEEVAVEMENEGNNIWSYTFYDVLPDDDVKGFLFTDRATSKNAWTSGTKQTVDLATEEGKNLFVPEPGNGNISGKWDVYNP